MQKILLVEDDTSLALAMEFTFKSEGFDVKHAKNISLATDYFNTDTFDLLVLDIMLPDGNGYDLCKEIRKKSQVPIVFLTACDEEVNVVMGLDIGGDDYITKPFRIKELISRIRAVLRRHQNNSIQKVPVKSTTFISGDLILDTSSGKLKNKNQDIILTALEYKLILLFFNNPLVLLERNLLLEKIWDVNSDFVDNNTLSVYIKRLREKIEENSQKPKYIVTSRGLGYIWNFEVKGE